GGPAAALRHLRRRVPHPQPHLDDRRRPPHARPGARLRRPPRLALARPPGARESLGSRLAGVAGRVAADGAQLRGAAAGGPSVRLLRAAARLERGGLRARDGGAVAMTGEGSGAGGPAELHERPPRLAAHFASMGVQLDASRLGIWLFLASEVLFFGGLLGAYAVSRANHPELFRYGHAFLDWRLGALNTAVLIGSSLSAAWSVRCAQHGRRRGLVVTLLVTLALASVFMGVKGVEYGHKLRHGVSWGSAYRPSTEILAALPAALRAAPSPPHVGTFFSLYFLLTG